MVKYRSLSTDELLELEKEFVNFLILNGITAEDWERFKITDKEYVNNLIDLFSNMVFEKIMLGVKFLEFRSDKEVKAFQCLGNKIIELSVKLDANSQTNFADEDKFTSNKFESKLCHSEKEYFKEREIEIFEMIESGCVISDGTLFKKLCLYLPK